MDRLRPRHRETFSGFTKSEIEKMEKLLDKQEESFSKEFCVKLAKGFNRSSARAGKPVIKWQEVQDWLQKRCQEHPNVLSSNKVSKNATVPASPQKIAHDDAQLPKAEEKTPDLSEIEFEAKSAKDGAWYDVEMFLAHRYVDSGEVEVLVRFVGFGAEEDEWINVKNAVRERSVPLESSECHKVKVGDVLLCFQERRDRAIHYDAEVMEIQRRMHDIRGCRCLFSIQYLHDNSKERVRLRRLCSRPAW